MAKVPFTKLALSKDNSIKELDWNGQQIEIKQYLPVGDKLDLISRVMNLTLDLNLFYNPCKVEIFELLEIIFTYTNINITDKQSENTLKLYDLLVSSGFAKSVKDMIPTSELDYIHQGVQAVIHEIYRYRDSAMGIMEQITADQKMTEDGLTNMIEEIKNSEEIKRLQDISTQLG